MKKIFLTLAGLTLLGSGNAWALVGGPFDNGDYSLLNERGGFYQCVFSYRNGNGFGVFSPDTQFADGIVGGGGATGATGTFFGPGTLYTDNSFNANHSGNRSVFFFKGVTYVGSCMGEVDFDARQIQGICNALSDDASTIGFTQGTLGTSNARTSVSRIVTNNAGFVLNASFTGKITSSRPVVRFTGKGELDINTPNPDATISNLAFQAYSTLINNIAQNPSATGSYIAAQAAIQSALADLATYLTNSGTDALYNSMDRVRLKVKGSRRFF